MATRKAKPAEPQAVSEPVAGVEAHNRNVLQAISDEQRNVATTVSTARAAGEVHPGQAVDETTATAKISTTARAASQPDAAPHAAADPDASKAAVGDTAAKPEGTGKEDPLAT
jgi:hypothetical protein